MVLTVDCRCGSTQVQRICSEMGLYDNKLPTCERPCRGLRACGKHQCTNRCCPAKNKGKGKKVDLAAHEAHICTLVCGKKLQCGIHSCEMLCHKGHCNPCMNTSFHDLSCSCGRTVMQAPIPCGTPIPKCRYTCTRTRSCGHASLTTHPCHPDSEPCPPCIMLVPKQCMCRKSKMPNVPCYKSNPSCGKVCGKKLDCGLHNCIKSCHSGECTMPPNDTCTQACPKSRTSCGHKCGVSCHGQTPCPEDQPCTVMIPSSCKCGNLTMEAPCNATAENPWDGKPRVIKCNDYCLIAERNKRVALALDIEDGPPPGPRIPEFDAYVLDYASANMEFCLKVEKTLAEWVADTSKPILYFPPMKGHRRKFVHELASYYNVTSESVDVEPYRSVTIRRMNDTSVPGLLVSQASRQKRTPGMPLSSSSSGGVEQLRKPQIKDPVNAIYLHDLAFGLTRSELAAQLAPVFGTIKYGIRWLTDDDAVLVPHPGSMQMDEFEAVLVRLRNGIKLVSSKTNLAERVELCWVNREGQVTSHTNMGSNQAKRFFSPSSNQHLAQKPPPAKVVNAFALLDDEERLAAARKAEAERIMQAKEAAGTLSNDAWEEEATGAVAAPIAIDLTATGATASSSSSASSSASSSGPGRSSDGAVEDLNKFIVVEAGEFTDEVVDDWQELLDDDIEDTKTEKTTSENEAETSTKDVTEEKVVEHDDKDIQKDATPSAAIDEDGSKKDVKGEDAQEPSGPSSKVTSDDEAVLVHQNGSDIDWHTSLNIGRKGASYFTELADVLLACPSGYFEHRRMTTETRQATIQEWEEWMNDFSKSEIQVLRDISAKSHKVDDDAQLILANRIVRTHKINMLQESSEQVHHVSKELTQLVRNAFHHQDMTLSSSPLLSPRINLPSAAESPSSSSFLKGRERREDALPESGKRRRLENETASFRSLVDIAHALV
ncbi:FKBP12-associated protein [Podila epigama]|nr:FKBP12-associated protein [Podila epigama]